jgi:hypothetical protein
MVITNNINTTNTNTNTNTMEPPPPINNPGNAMGPQSQRMLNQKERTYQLAAANRRQNKRRKTGQQTLFGETAFESPKDCPVCKGRCLQLDS